MDADANADRVSSRGLALGTVTRAARLQSPARPGRHARGGPADGRIPERHDRIADELVDRPDLFLDGARHDLEVVVEQRRGVGSSIASDIDVKPTMSVNITVTSRCFEAAVAPSGSVSKRRTTVRGT